MVGLGSVHGWADWALGCAGRAFGGCFRSAWAFGFSGDVEIGRGDTGMEGDTSAFWVCKGKKRVPV